MQGTVTGSSNLAVPVGTTSVRFTGQGGAGVYNAGQSFIASTSLAWILLSTGIDYTQSGYTPPVDQRYSTRARDLASTAWAVGSEYWFQCWSDSDNGNGGWEYRSYSIRVTSLYAAGKPYIAPYYTAGTSTTTSSAQSTNGSKTWASHASAGNPSAYDQYITFAGTGGTVAYSVAAGTSLQYDYDYFLT